MLDAEPPANFLRTASNHAALERFDIRILREPVCEFIGWGTRILSMVTLKSVNISTDLKYALGSNECGPDELIKALQMGVHINCLRVCVRPGVDQKIKDLCLGSHRSQINSVLLFLGEYTQSFDLVKTMRGIFEHIHCQDVTLGCIWKWFKQQGTFAVPTFAEVGKIDPELEISYCEFHAGDYSGAYGPEWDAWISESKLKKLEVLYSRKHLLEEHSLLNTIPIHCSGAESVLLDAKTSPSDYRPPSMTSPLEFCLRVENIVCLPMESSNLDTS
jgi:hypothetical protein